MVGGKLVSPLQIELAKEIQNRRDESLESILLRLHWVKEEEILKTEGQVWNIPLFTKEQQNEILPKLLKNIPEFLCRKYNLFPIAQNNGQLCVAMTDPFDLVALDDLQRITKTEIKPYLGSKKDILSYIEKYYTNDKKEEETEKDIKEDVLGDIADIQLDVDEKFGDLDEDDSQLKVNPDDPPVIKLVNYVLGQAITDKASDIHIEPLEHGLKVRYRIDGSLFELIKVPQKHKAAIISRTKILSGMDIAIKRVPQDGSFTVYKDDKQIDFRVSSLPIIYGEKIVLRLLEKDAVSGKTLDGLGMSAYMVSLFKKYMFRPHGMILVTGPTGSGKSTTLYTVLNQINSPYKNIITVEDPVEYRLPGIQQVQVRSELGFDFADALRTILRQDPDIIMIGEIRDQETAQIAVKSSLTGHLVLSTLHTNDAPGAIIRLVNIGLEKFLVASSVNLAIAQRLTKRICINCKESFEADKSEKKMLGVPEDQPLILYKARGCSKCRQTGFKGRLAVMEMFEMSPEIREMMMADVPIDQIRDKAIEQGMVTLKQYGFEKVIDGITTIDEVLAVCVEEK